MLLARADEVIDSRNFVTPKLLHLLRSPLGTFPDVHPCPLYGRFRG